ncbi:hypothetical protein Tco_0277383 [Tanacetum coccineum]
MAVKNLFQPWRAILSMINQCITGKTSRFDRPRYPVLQMFWGIVTCINVDYAELMWEEFVQAIQTFLTDKDNQGSPTKKGKKTKPHVIPYCRRSLTVNPKFVPKGKDDEVFGMKIPKELIIDDIRKAPYYKAYLDMFVDEDEEIQHEPEPQYEGKDDDFKHAIRMSLDSFQVERQVPVGGVAIHSTNVPKKGTDSEEAKQWHRDMRYLKINKTAMGDSGEASLQWPLEAKTAELKEKTIEEDQARSDPGKSHVVPARPNPEPMHEDFMAIIYPKVHESLKLPADEHVILEDLLSSSGTLSLMKNLDDIYTFGDLFFDDKSTEDEPGKPNVDAKVVSMVIVPIYQANTSSPPLSTPVIEISSPKLSLSPAHSPIVTATPITTTTTTLALPPPPPT